MKLKIQVIILLFFIGNSFFISAQNYTQYARIVYTFKKTNAPVSDYKKFLDTVDYPFPEVYTKALLLINLQDTINLEDSLFVTDCFKRLVLNGYHKELYFDFLQNFDKEYATLGKTIFRKYKPIFEDTHDMSLLKHVQTMQEQDQKVREKKNENWTKILRVDSINRIELMKMIRQYGKLPGIRELGYEGMNNMIIMLRHLDGDTAFLNYFHSILLQQVKEGDFPPERVASLIDYHWSVSMPIMIDSTQGYPCQLYGTTSFRIDKSHKLLVPVRDKQETERLRKEIGLPSLEEAFKDDPQLLYDEELFKSKYTMKINPR